MSSADKLTEAVAQFRRTCEAGRLAHAYLVIAAPRGEGRAFAESCLKLLFCQGLVKPCGACAACGQIAGHQHPDVEWVEPEKKSRVIAVDAMRETNRLMGQKSYLGGWKAAVILHADRLKEAAATAFLKTLEEPRPQTLFLLISDAPNEVLPTIVSRCQRILIAGGERLPDGNWLSPLLDILRRPPARKELEALAAAGRVAALLNEEKMRIKAQEEAEEPADEALAGPAAEAASDVSDEVTDARREAKLRQVRTDMMLVLNLWLRDVLWLTSGGDPSRLVFPADEPALRTWAAGLDTAAAMELLRRAEEAVRRLERNLRPELALEQLFLNLAAIRPN